MSIYSNLQISFFSTSPELSNKQRFEYFSRTIPSDHYQTMAMAKIVERLGWKYMSIVYEESNYGIKVICHKISHYKIDFWSSLHLHKTVFVQKDSFEVIFLLIELIQSKSI